MPNRKRYYKGKDPHLAREAEQYEHPVPSREFISDYLDSIGEPAALEALAGAFHLEAEEEFEGLRRRLRAMERDGQVISNRRGHYALVNKMDLVRGRIQGHRDGFGFLIPDEPGDDIFLSAREMRTVFTDDRVLVHITSCDQRRKEGRIVEILERNTHQIVGRYLEEQGLSFVDPDSKSMPQEVLIAPEHRGAAKPGQFVVVEITAQPTRRRQAMGRVIDVLGDHLTPGMEVELAIRSHDLPYEWSGEVEREAKKLPATVPESDKKSRNDYRQLPFVTIDGEDAKDFDDAVYCEPSAKGGWTLYVAIADVSHYVRCKMALDQEAERRGNSVYFRAKVIPMLPEALSNGLCSLKPKVDRLVMVCKMQIDPTGVIQDFEFSEGVIHSHARLTYTEVAEMLKGNEALNTDLLPQVKQLYALYQKLLQQRECRGAIDFETVETKIKFDDKGKIEKIVPTERNDAHRLIEEMMLAANVCTAHFLEKHRIPILYRVHDKPEEQKLLALRDFLKAFSLKLGGGKSPSAMDYAKLLGVIAQRPDAHLLQTVMLRSLRQAVYTSKNGGHFGLSYDAYAHFTSPIRRYPDLLVHRAIKHILNSRPLNAFLYDHESMNLLGDHCSMTERRADRATRDATDWLKCEFMQDKVGDVYPGRIVDVKGFGVFIELDDIYVQGLLHITSLKSDYYHYDATHHLLRGKRGNQVYRLGDAIEVLVARVDLDERSIDFELPESEKKGKADKFSKHAKPKKTRKPSKQSRKNAEQEKSKKEKKSKRSRKSKTSSKAGKPAKKTTRRRRKET